MRGLLKSFLAVTAPSLIVTLIGLDVVRLQTQLHETEARRSVAGELAAAAADLDRVLGAAFDILSRSEGIQTVQLAEAPGPLPAGSAIWSSDGDTVDVRGDPAIAEALSSWRSFLQFAAPEPLQFHLGPDGTELLVLSRSDTNLRNGSAWTGIALSMEVLLETAGIQALARQGLNVHLIPESDVSASIFWTLAERPAAPESAALATVPWVLSAEPLGGWVSSLEVWRELFYVCLLVTLFVCTVGYLAQRPGELERRVGELNDSIARKDSRLLAMSSAQAQLEAELRTSEDIDRETGVASRSSFVRLLDGRLGEARLFADVFVFVVSLPQLGSARSSLGDNAARRFAGAIRQRLVDNGVSQESIGRTGPNEFAILVQGAEDRVAEVAAEDLVRALGGVYEVEGYSVSLHCTVGISRPDSASVSGGELLERASLAAGDAEQSGSKWNFYQPERHRDRITTLQLEADLLDAVTAGQLELHYQPVVALADGTLSGFEALIRWRHPVHGVISPDRLLPLARSGGHMDAVTRWVIDAATSQVRDWLEKYQRPFYVTVNFTPDIFNSELCQYLVETITDKQIPFESIGVEITETSIVSDYLAAADLIRWLKSREIRVLLDDFGVGYSSLSYLRELPFSAVKIDRSFVTHMATNSRDFGLVRSIVDLSRYLGMQCVAEGIETDSQLELLMMTSCDYWQGFLFSGPRDAAEAERFLRENRTYQLFAREA